MKHPKLKVFLSTLLTIFNLGVCFAGTYAWFVSAKTNNASTMQVQMYTHELDTSFNIYKYDDNQKCGVLTNELKLEKYDSVILSRNEYTPIIIEFKITGMSIGEDIPVLINVHCTNNTLNARVLSNIIRLKFAIIPTIGSSDTPAAIYSKAITAFGNEGEYKFKEDEEKRQDIEYPLENYSQHISGGNLKLYIFLDYAADLVSEFTFDYDDPQTTSFANDLTEISCGIINED